MKIIFKLSLLFVLFNFAVAAQTNTITQYSTIDALLKGNFDSKFTIKEVKSYGDFGIGTFDKLDGEMVVYDGVVYQVKGDGSINIVSDEMTSPFMTVTKFTGQITNHFNNSLNYTNCIKFIDSLLPSPNYFYAIKITGKFKTIKTRSVYQQEKPYKLLTEIVKNQSIFNLENIDGTIVGFRSPVFSKGVNVPGYHLHFLADDKKSGGHILDFVTDDIKIEIEKITEFKMILPEDGIFQNQDFTTDNYEDLKAVEKK